MWHRFRWISRFMRDNRGVVVFLVCLGVFRGAIADWNPVPTQSMNPTIIGGDVIWVNKLAYDLKLPFTQLSLAELDRPQRGDIVVFKSQAADKRLVKRVVGLPGDSIGLNNNRLIINGASQAYELLGGNSVWQDLEESLLDYRHEIRIAKRAKHPLQTFAPVTIPAGYYLVLGDNRDNSADSRVYGLVPHAELVGKASHVVLSFDPHRYYLPRLERVIKPLI